MDRFWYIFDTKNRILTWTEIVFWPAFCLSVHTRHHNVSKKFDLTHTCISNEIFSLHQLTKSIFILNSVDIFTSLWWICDPLIKMTFMVFMAFMAQSFRKQNLCTLSSDFNLTRHFATSNYEKRLVCDPFFPITILFIFRMILVILGKCLSPSKWHKISRYSVDFLHRELENSLGFHRKSEVTQFI